VIDKLRGTAIPLVGLVGGAGAPFDFGVAGDFVHDAELAIEHLLALGHRRIAVLNGPPELEPCIARAVGVDRALTRAGLDPDDVLLRLSTDTFEISAGEACLAQVLAADPRPTAVFAVTDVLAVGLMHAALRAGLTVPRDLAVVGVGDMSMGATAAVPLTTVHYPAYEMGRSAATLLFDPPGTPQVVRFSPELVARASTVG
jgi:LacI family transcriptional regulator